MTAQVMHKVCQITGRKYIVFDISQYGNYKIRYLRELYFFVLEEFSFSFDLMF